MRSYRIRRQSLQDAIQDSVKRYIVDHRFRPGDALPTEAELAAHLEVSRQSLREALKVLQTIGVVDVRQGRGAFVGSLSLDKLAEGMAFQILLDAQHNPSPPADLLDLVAMRQALETHQMREAVGRHSNAQIATIRSMLAEMQRLDPQSTHFGERDLALHLAFYEPLHSHVFSEFLRLFWTITNETIRLYARAPQTVIAIEHQRIVAAIAARDATAAVAAVRDHLDHLAETIRSRYLPMDR